MFESNMDEYLDEEVEYIKHSFEMTCRSWEKQVSSSPLTFDSRAHGWQLSEHRVATGTPANAETARFLGSHNPAQVKRTVLASFTDVLLLPVTIVPRAVGAAITTGSTAAVQGIQMLNPQRWGGQSANGSVTSSFGRMSYWNANGKDGYVRDFEKGGDGMLFDIGADEDDEEPDSANRKSSGEKTPRCE